MSLGGTIEPLTIPLTSADLKGCSRRATSPWTGRESTNPSSRKRVWRDRLSRSAALWRNSGSHTQRSGLMGLGLGSVKSSPKGFKQVAEGQNWGTDIQVKGGEDADTDEGTP